MCYRTCIVRMLVWCASPSLVNVRVVRFVAYNARVCKWSGFYNTGMCECLFNQRASGVAFTTPECASGPVFTTPKCAGASLVNVRVVLL